MKTWLMMGLIFVGLIGFVIYTTIRDKKKNKTSRKDYNNLMSDANIKRDELMMELLSIIKLLLLNVILFINIFLYLIIFII